MTLPVRCFAGQFHGGHDKRCQLTGIKLVLDSTTADTLTELEIADWNYLDDSFQESKLKRVFHHKASADDSGQYFNYAADPIRCDNGIMVLKNTNCRPIFYIP